MARRASVNKFLLALAFLPGLSLASTVCGPAPSVDTSISGPMKEEDGKLSCPPWSFVLQNRLRNSVDKTERLLTGGFLQCNAAKKAWSLVFGNETFILGGALSMVLPRCARGTDCDDMPIEGGAIIEELIHCPGKLRYNTRTQTNVKPDIQLIECHHSSWESFYPQRHAFVTSVTCDTCPRIPVGDNVGYDFQTFSYYCVAPKKLHVSNGTLVKDGGRLACDGKDWVWKPEGSGGNVSITNIKELRC